MSKKKKQVIPAPPEGVDVGDEVRAQIRGEVLEQTMCGPYQFKKALTRDQVEQVFAGGEGRPFPGAPLESIKRLEETSDEPRIEGD